MLRQSVRQMSMISRFPKLAEITAKDIHNPDFGFKTYFLERTAYGNLPVYSEFKQGVPYTEVRKVKGDIVQLRNDLQEVLTDVPRENFKILMESKKLLIKRCHPERVNEALKEHF